MFVMHEIALTNRSPLDTIHAPRHRFKNPFTMSKTRAADPPATGKDRIAFRFILEKCKLGGAYRDRTDDPLLAKQVLSQLS